MEQPVAQQNIVDHKMYCRCFRVAVEALILKYKIEAAGKHKKNTTTSTSNASREDALDIDNGDTRKSPYIEITSDAISQFATFVEQVDKVHG